MCKTNSPQEQNLKRIRASARETGELLKTHLPELDADYERLIQSAAQVAFEVFLKRKKKEKELALARDYIHLVAEAQRIAVQKQRHGLDRERWEFDTARVCVTHFQELQKIISRKDIDDEERVAEFYRRLFGEKPPSVTLPTKVS